MRQGLGMLLCGFFGRHKLLWSALKELKLLLALDTAGALDNVSAFLRWALRASHLLTGQGDTPNALFVFKIKPRLPRYLSSPQIPAAGRFSSGGCWMLSSLSSWCLLPEGGSEGFFSFLGHLGTGRGSDGRWEVELGVQGEAWWAVRSHPVPPEQAGGHLGQP